MDEQSQEKIEEMNAVDAADTAETGDGKKQKAKKPAPGKTKRPPSATKQKAAAAAKSTAKPPKPKSPAAKPVQTKPKSIDRYFEAVGRRKTAIARVRLFTKAGDFLVNEKPYAGYFTTTDQQKIAEEALQKMKLFGRFRVSAKISGGGVHAQAEALRHGLARCLIKFNPDFRKRLKRAGLLTRDPRAKERKKFGLKKARKAPQWAKR